MARGGKKHKPSVVCRFENGKLTPATSFDAELMQELYRPGADYYITAKRVRRSLPQLAAYWIGLKRIVDATEAYPTRNHMHEALKVDAGFVEERMTPRGARYKAADSIAMEEMDQDQFNTFLEIADRICLEVYGIGIMDQEYRKVA